MKKLLSLLIIGASLSLTDAEATQPLRRHVQTVAQSDGTTITVRHQASANFAFYTSTDGLALVKGADGHLYYASLPDDGLAASAVLAHNADDRHSDEQAFVRTAAISAEQAAEHLSHIYATPYVRTTRGRAATTDGLGSYGTPAQGVVSSIGTPVIPVIMAEFADLAFQDTITTAKLSRWLNEPGYHDEAGSVGSVHDYFTAQSDGLFSPTFQVLAKVKLSKGYAYYGEDSSNGSTDRHKYDFVQEVLDSACAAGVDFSAFANGGSVSNVSIFYAGPGEHSAYEAGYEDYLWAHFSSRAFTTKTGVRINSYFIGNELLQDYFKEDGSVEYSDDAHNYPIAQSAAMDGIGVFCHEFSHALGLPDFYYTGSNDDIADTLKTMWYWSIMDYGQYYTDGYAPVGYNAYERSFMGWLEVKDLTEAQIVTLPALTTTDTDLPRAYCLRNAANTSEYYLLENRQPGTWYPSGMGRGLLITHVDYLASAWDANTVNNTPSHHRFGYVPADNEKENRHFRDLFPYNGQDEFSDTSTPASTVFTGTSLGKPLYGITKADDLVTFCFLDKALTGIDRLSVSDEASPRRVYTIDGRYVRTLAPADVIADKLPAGLYVVVSGTQHEKVIVK